MVTIRYVQRYDARQKCPLLVGARDRIGDELAFVAGGALCNPGCSCQSSSLSPPSLLCWYLPPWNSTLVRRRAAWRARVNAGRACHVRYVAVCHTAALSSILHRSTAPAGSGRVGRGSQHCPSLYWPSRPYTGVSPPTNSVNRSHIVSTRLNVTTDCHASLAWQIGFRTPLPCWYVTE